MKQVILFVLCLFTISARRPSFRMISRAAWGARSPRYDGQMLLRLPVTHIFIHHTAGAQCYDLQQCKDKTKQIQKSHQFKRRFPDIGYSFLIGGNGFIYEGVGWKKVGTHTKGHNRNSIGISFHGDFTRKAPSKAMLAAAQRLIDYGVRSGFIKRKYRLHGHRDGSRTKCPGDALYKIIKRWRYYSRFV